MTTDDLPLLRNSERGSFTRCRWAWRRAYVDHLKPISEGVNNKYTKLVLDYKFNDPKDPNRIYYRSDHFNFAAKGIPIIFYYDGMLLADYHKPTDTPDKINYPLLAKRAQLVFHTAWEMANREEMLKRDKALD